MSRNRGKSKGHRDAHSLTSDGVQATHPQSGSPSKGMAGPIQNPFVTNVENLKSVEGGSSICRLVLNFW
ncbi:hypothetical protein OROGR_026604 [Orobanche gracilis]